MKRVVCCALFLTATTLQASIVLSEGFDNVSGLTGSGWVMLNNSVPLGTSGWFQGNPAIFPAHSGADNSYIGANFENAAFGGVIDNWLMTPVLTLMNGDVLSFYTRSVGSDFPDRLEIRMSTNGASSNVADFSVVLGIINDGLAVGGYPTDWSLVSARVSGLGGATTGRYALRYSVPNTAFNADYIGVDTLVVDAIPEPGLWLGVGVGLAGLIYFRRRTLQ